MTLLGFSTLFFSSPGTRHHAISRNSHQRESALAGKKEGGRRRREKAWKKLFA